MEIKRFDVTEGGSRLVVHGGAAYFTGHASPFHATLSEQTAGVCRRYDELFKQFGLRKEHIIAMYAYLKDMGEAEEFEVEWNRWIGTADAPAGIIVEASPIQGGAFGDNVRLELALIVAVEKGSRQESAADDEEVVYKVEIHRFDEQPGCSRLVIHNQVAYFTGHSARPGFTTLKEQTKAVCERYDELFARFGLKKENIIMANIYLKDIGMVEEFNEVYRSWLNGESAPAGVAVQAPPSGENNLLELQFIVACNRL